MLTFFAMSSPQLTLHVCLPAVFMPLHTPIGLSPLYVPRLCRLSLIWSILRYMILIVFCLTSPARNVTTSAQLLFRELQPDVSCGRVQNLWRRNIHIKRFEGIPIADTELIFPEKKIFLKPITILQLAVTVIGGLIAAFVTLWGVRLLPYSIAS